LDFLQGVPEERRGEGVIVDARAAVLFESGENGFDLGPLDFLLFGQGRGLDRGQGRPDLGEKSPSG
jgi:hypothetical protein